MYCIQITSVASCLTHTVSVTDSDCNVGEERNIRSARYGNLDNSRIVLRVLGIPILLRVIGILKTRSTILELAVRVLGIWTVLEFLKSTK